MSTMYTCPRCKSYSTNLKSNLKRHMNRKRKCPLIIQNEAKSEQIDTQNSYKSVQNGQNNAQNGQNNAQNIQLESQRITTESQKNHTESQRITKTWECIHCSKTFTTNSNMNRHIRLYCSLRKDKDNMIQQLQDEVRQLRSQMSSTITNNNSNSNNSNSYNTINNNNITLPDGQWNRVLQNVMVHLISKIGNGIFPGELDFSEAFQQTLSVAHFHPDSPLFDSVEMLGRKESWVKHNGKLVRKSKLLKKINQEHYNRLIQFMNDTNRRYRTELPSLQVIQKWIEVNNEIISHIKKYDPCNKCILQTTEEVLRNKSLPQEYNALENNVRQDELASALIIQRNLL